MHGRIDAVVDAGLCVGCGACTTSDIAPGGARMVLTPSGLLRPRFDRPMSEEEQERALPVCPAVRLDLQPLAPVHPDWGPLVRVRMGWASDVEVRFRGSSGGGLSALLIHLLQSSEVSFVAHVAVTGDDPLANERYVSRSREEVLAGAGSRYAPAAGAVALGSLFVSGERFAFVGKPCEVAALKAYVAQRPVLQSQLALVASFMCAGTPSLRGTHAVLAALDVDASQVDAFQYRGNGWPGLATVRTRDGRVLQMDYKRSWGEFLGPQLQLRCKLCPDGTGEFADVVFADAWYGREGFPDFEERDGRSLVISRTPRGETALNRAADDGALVLEDASVDEIAAMQPYQLTRKRVVLGRWLAVGLRTGIWPRFRGLHLSRALFRGGWLPALRNAWGTFRRIGRRND